MSGVGLPLFRDSRFFGLSTIRSDGVGAGLRRWSLSFSVNVPDFGTFRPANAGVFSGRVCSDHVLRSRYEKPLRPLVRDGSLQNDKKLFLSILIMKASNVTLVLIDISTHNRVIIFNNVNNYFNLRIFIEKIFTSLVITCSVLTAHSKLKRG